ncbi:MAG: hypothetical protein Q9228_000301 [Teloschistes exilis]
MSYDKLGEAAYDRLNGLYPPPSEKQGTSQATEDSEAKDRRSSAEGKSRKRDMFLLLRDHAHEDRVLSSLWTEVNTIPQWVCWDQIARGQEVFYRYGGPALTGLAFQSLLGGMVGIAPQSSETTQHILQCTKDLYSIQPGGAGHASSIRVRLLHAAVRRRILRLARSNPEYFNVDEYGVPINDLDCVCHGIYEFCFSNPDSDRNNWNFQCYADLVEFSQAGDLVEDSQLSQIQGPGD